MAVTDPTALLDAARAVIVSPSTPSSEPIAVSSRRLLPDAGLGARRRGRSSGHAAARLAGLGRFEGRSSLRSESLELAFVAAVQHLPARQRAVLLLREVLGFSAAEVAASLETSVASVNSALQRARRATEGRLPDQSQQATLRALGDEGVRELVEGYMRAWERGDVRLSDSSGRSPDHLG